MSIKLPYSLLDCIKNAKGLIEGKSGIKISFQNNTVYLNGDQTQIKTAAEIISGIIKQNQDSISPRLDLCLLVENVDRLKSRGDFPKYFEPNATRFKFNVVGSKISALVEFSTPEERDVALSNNPLRENQLLLFSKPSSPFSPNSDLKPSSFFSPHKNPADFSGLSNFSQSSSLAVSSSPVSATDPLRTLWVGAFPPSSDANTIRAYFGDAGIFPTQVFLLFTFFFLSSLSLSLFLFIFLFLFLFFFLFLFSPSFFFFLFFFHKI
jgi:hypothetical protein